MLGLFSRSRRNLFQAALFISPLVMGLAVAHPVKADGKPQGEGTGDRSLRLLSLAPVPPTTANTTGKAMYVFDISFVDQKTQTYYLADRSNAVVDVVDAQTGEFKTQLSATPPFKGFTGNNGTSGPNGVVAAFPWLFVTDANSRVVTIDVRTGKTVADVSTGGAPNLRADELAYDPDDGMLLVINNADTPPFGTLIKVNQSRGADGGHPDHL